MRLSRLPIVTMLLFLAALPVLHAQVSGSPYSVTVPVTDTSDAQRSQAFATALGQVLTRVAGGQDLRGNPGYGDALQDAGSMVQKFQYQKAATGLILDVDFAPGTVRRLVSKLGVASAGVKPPVLLLVAGPDGKLLDPSALGALAAAAAERGTNVVYPVAGPVDLARVAAADPAALAAINRQYHTGLVLLGSLQGGHADWTLIAGGQPQRWTDQGVTRDALLVDAGNRMVDRVGRQLNVVGVSVSEGTLWVSGLQSAGDYASLLSLLHNDPSVQEVATQGAENDGVLLSIKASLPLNGLAANLAASGRLLLQGQPHAGADASLRWLH